MPGSQYVGTSPNKQKPSENKKARDLRKRAVALIRLLSRFVRNQAYYPRVFFPEKWRHSLRVDISHFTWQKKKIRDVFHIIFTPNLLLFCHLKQTGE